MSKNMDTRIQPSYLLGLEYFKMGFFNSYVWVRGD